MTCVEAINQIIDLKLPSDAETKLLALVGYKIILDISKSLAEYLRDTKTSEEFDNGEP